MLLHKIVYYARFRASHIYREKILHDHTLDFNFRYAYNPV